MSRILHLDTGPRGPGLLDPSMTPLLDVLETGPEARGADDSCGDRPRSRVADALLKGTMSLETALVHRPPFGTPLQAAIGKSG